MDTSHHQQSKIKTRKARPTLLVVDLKELKTPWQSWCSARGLKPSDAVRKILGHLVSGDVETSLLPHPDVTPMEGNSKPRRLEVRLSEADHAALTEAARRDGMGLPRWFQALVAIHLSGRDQFGADEVAALSRSNTRLTQLGTNINQIARHMNEDPGSDELTLAQINHVLAAIEEHRTYVRQLLHGNRYRWRR